MASISAIRAGLETRLQTITAFQQVSAYRLSEPTPPCAQIFRGETDYDVTMSRGADMIEFVVQVFAGLTTDVNAPVLLEQMVDTTGSLSVKAAIEGDKTLGGACSSLRVTQAGPEMEVLRASGQSLLMCEFTVQVLT